MKKIVCMFSTKPLNSVMLCHFQIWKQLFVTFLNQKIEKYGKLL